jgi:hypothetical protein
MFGGNFIHASGMTSSCSCLDHGQTGGYCGPEVGFWEIAIDLPQARLWIASKR